MKNVKIVIAAFMLLTLEGYTMSSPVSDSWVYATILIQNEWGGKGTGFLVQRQVDSTISKIFLCTNKHVLNEDPSLRQAATNITCHLNVKEASGNIVGKQYQVDLTFPNGTKRWKEHPDPEVDVLVFDITDLIVSVPEIVKKWARYDLFADTQILASEAITIGEEVMVIGYPLGFHQGATNFPIVRQGIVATQIGKTFQQESIDSKGNPVTRVYRGFLIDGASIPGSSGSPVILKPVTGRLVGISIKMGVPKPYLLGILAETRFAPIKVGSGTIPSFAGLGLAFDASTVRETIELFFP